MTPLGPRRSLLTRVLACLGFETAGSRKNVVDGAEQAVPLLYCRDADLAQTPSLSDGAGATYSWVFPSILISKRHLPRYAAVPKSHSLTTKLSGAAVGSS